MYLFRLRVLSIVCAVVIASLIPPTLSWPTWWPARRGGDGGYGGHHPHDNHRHHPHHHHHNDNDNDDDDTIQRNFNTVSRIYNLTVYPNQLPIFQIDEAGVPKGLFNNDVVGRVDPVGTFVGFQDSIEYFFALSPLPQGNPAQAAITSYKITEFTSACSNIAASVVYLFCNVVAPGSPDNGKQLMPLKQVAFWRFDEDGAVLKYDAWIPNLNIWVQATTGGLVTDPQFQMQSIQQLCLLTQMRCTGPNTQWASFGECVAALSQKPYGNYDEAWDDNIVCRNIHLVLTQVRPDVHCSHVGPSGGGKCIDGNLNNYFGDEALYGDPLGESFMCDE